MKEHVRETAKINDKEDIWSIDLLLKHIRSMFKKKKLSEIQIRSACMASIITFTNLRLSELYEAEFKSITATEAKLVTMIYKGT
jgi:hypothetical protein